MAGFNEIARARADIDLAVVSVLLDAGAGPDGSFLEGGTRFIRSEGFGDVGDDIFGTE